MSHTKREFNRFDKLTYNTGSQNHLTRIQARLSLQAFITEHGKEKCDEMFAEIKRREKANALRIAALGR